MRQDKIGSSLFKKPHRHLLDADLRFRTLSYDCVLKRLVRFQKLSPDFWNFCRIKTVLPDFQTRQIRQILDVRFQRLSSYFTHLRRISDGFFRFWKALLLQKEIERMSKEKINEKNQREKMKQGKNRLIDERTSGVNWRPSIDFERFFPI